jgi:hypothetical protein
LVIVHLEEGPKCEKFFDEASKDLLVFSSSSKTTLAL